MLWLLLSCWWRAARQRWRRFNAVLPRLLLLLLLLQKWLGMVLTAAPGSPPIRWHSATPAMRPCGLLLLQWRRPKSTHGSSRSLVLCFRVAGP